MALFGSKETKLHSSQHVRPTVVRTRNVARELQNIARSYEIKVDSLDFNILEVQTYTRINDGSKETEWELVNEHSLYELDEDTALLNPNFQIKQTYEIEIFTPSKEIKQICPNLIIAVGANASKCKVYLSIAAGSKIESTPHLESDFKNLINKRKIRAGILINIFDEMLNAVTSKISAQARVDNGLEYTQKETILIAEGFEPTVTVNDKLVLHYEDNAPVEENEKVDYASRGFIQSVKKDELLIEYIKPRLGLPGRNCRGEFMQPTEPIVQNEVTFTIDSSIRQVETDESIQYIANENGYIAFNDNTYTIKTDMDVGEISFKTTGSIKSGVDSDVNLSVKETDAIKDAIGTGMQVEVSEIMIDGNVGSNAKVVALKATVGGQTHKTATVKADKLDINIHKGKAYGKNITITRLEHGDVDGDTVHIKQALGGTIKAKEIVMDICASHVNAIASKRIEIKKLHGSENSFSIDPLVQKKVQSGLNENKKEIDNLKYEVSQLQKEVKKYTTIIEDGKASFMEIKKRLLHYKKSGVKMPSSFVQKYKQYTNLQEKLEEVKKEFSLKSDNLMMHTNKTVTFQGDILDARVINKDRWVGYNEIKFKLVEPPIELIYKPAEGSREKIFGLVEVEDGEFEIEAMNE